MNASKNGYDTIRKPITQKGVAYMPAAYSKEVNTGYETQVAWFNDHGVPYMPLLILNNRLLPQRYYDTGLLINVLEKQLEEQEVSYA